MCVVKVYNNMSVCGRGGEKEECVCVCVCAGVSMCVDPSDERGEGEEKDACEQRGSKTIAHVSSMVKQHDLYIIRYLCSEHQSLLHILKHLFYNSTK